MTKFKCIFNTWENEINREEEIQVTFTSFPENSEEIRAKIEALIPSQRLKDFSFKRVS